MAWPHIQDSGLSWKTALCCDTCHVALPLDKVPADAVAKANLEETARLIAAHQPEALPSVTTFLYDHRGHDIAMFALTSLDDYQKTLS